MEKARGDNADEFEIGSDNVEFLKKLESGSIFGTTINIPNGSSHASKRPTARICGHS